MLNTDHRTAPSIVELAERVRADSWFDIGYPSATDITYPELADFLSSLRLINLGDPWDEGTIAHHTKPIEREVVNIVADLLHAPPSRWGYVTTGSSEGTECAIQEASRAYPGLVVYASTGRALLGSEVGAQVRAAAGADTCQRPRRDGCRRSARRTAPAPGLAGSRDRHRGYHVE